MCIDYWIDILEPYLCIVFLLQQKVSPVRAEALLCSTLTISRA